MAVAAVDFRAHRAQPCWTQNDKDQLLEALWIAHERSRLTQNSRKCRYKCKRYAEDQQFREAVNKVAADCKKRKYHSDPAYRERMKERARQWYHQKKLAACSAKDAYA